METHPITYLLLTTLGLHYIYKQTQLETLTVSDAPREANRSNLLRLPKTIAPERLTMRPQERVKPVRNYRDPRLPNLNIARFPVDTEIQAAPQAFLTTTSNSKSERRAFLGPRMHRVLHNGGRGGDVVMQPS